MAVNDNTYFLHTPAQLYSPSPKFVHASELRNYTGFSSLYAVSGDIAQALQQEGTTKGFKGVVWAQRLWLDFDSYEAAERAGSKLEEMGLAFVAFDSGGRGMHFGVERDHLPSHLLPAKDKAWVRANFPEADSSIYTHLHLFRLPGTIHEKTHRPKKLIYEQQGRRLVLPPLAPGALSQPLPNASEQSIFNLERVMSNTLPAENGERHYQLIRLVYALRDDAGVDMQTAFWWVNEANKLHREPKSIEELETALRSIYEG